MTIEGWSPLFAQISNRELSDPMMELSHHDRVGWQSGTEAKNALDHSHRSANSSFDRCATDVGLQRLVGIWPRRDRRGFAHHRARSRIDRSNLKLPPLIEGCKMDQKSTSHSTPAAVQTEEKAGSLTDPINRDAIAEAANGAAKSTGSDLQAVRDDLKDTLTRFMSQASGEAVKSAREVRSNIAGQVSGVASHIADRGGQLASFVGGEAKTFAGEVESITRRNPLGSLVGAVAVVVLTGVMGRRS